jgi:hypothetical protein
MKRTLLTGLACVVLVYATGLVRLGEAGAMRFVMNMESLMDQGKADEVCAMFHDDLEIDITDNTASKPKHLTGGKQELCEQTRQSVAALKRLPHRSNVRFDDVAVKRDWLHPWTSELTYTEDRHLAIQAIGEDFHTISEDTLVLQHTFSGVKLRKLRAAARLAD